MQTVTPSRSLTRFGSWYAYLQLMRPANIVTAVADILAGAAVTLAAMGTAFALAELSLLAAASACIYAGGVVLNDVFDRKLDEVERPERPIPSGRASFSSAAVLGALLMFAGIGFAAAASWPSAGLAFSIALLAVLYDARAKHHMLAGPLCMGLCRGLNLLLGMSLALGTLADWWLLMLIPLAYIAAITAISRGEVHGGSRLTGWMAIILLFLVSAALLMLGATAAFQLFAALPFLAYFVGRVLPPFLRAARTRQPGCIRMAVKAGVLSLICLDATLAGGFGGLLYGAGVLLLLPLSLSLAKLFAVT